MYELAQTSAKIYTYGPIIHNEEVVGDLEKKGVSVIETKEELRQIKEGVIVIRSHGVAKEIYDQIEQQGPECVGMRPARLSSEFIISSKKRARKRKTDFDYRQRRTPGSRGDYGVVEYACDGSGVRRRNRTDPL